ncbi:MAG: helix-turn-helix domain-containing protein [Solirubrobacteraceae bacterium]
MLTEPDINETSVRPRNSLPNSVGPRIRAQREGLNMSLRKLASAVSVSPSLISQIEHGTARPSVATLYAIVNVLGMSLDTLFSEDGASVRDIRGTSDVPGPGRTVALCPVVRRSERSFILLGTGVKWERLTPEPDPVVDFLSVEYEVGGASSAPGMLMVHSGREYGLVLEGRLGAAVGFETFELESGDSIAFDSSTPHRFWTIGDAPAVVAWTVVGRGADPRVGPHQRAAPPERETSADRLQARPRGRGS